MCFDRSVVMLPWLFTDIRIYAGMTYGFFTISPRAKIVTLSHRYFRMGFEE